ncbi:hypothetical protein GCM10008959_09090 [Deinococcus seoulensis]|uniref:Uncharacterized protein n=1 Tax=Deinococcus seoulensis TaxID=1837379 RepID=A0ABQ2RMP3_9DEIO|nr:hypothetical protein [Deinococcus seoulensis]GGR50138.1 hypothetical protein GCM10008959_09090 [Deinococcus seoulensis]
MKAYKGVVENGVVVIIGGRLPEGTVVTVTVGEGELLRARITNVLKRPRKVKVRLKPNTGLAASFTERAAQIGSQASQLGERASSAASELGHALSGPLRQGAEPANE